MKAGTAFINVIEPILSYTNDTSKKLSRNGYQNHKMSCEADIAWSGTSILSI